MIKIKKRLSTIFIIMLSLLFISCAKNKTVEYPKTQEFVETESIEKEIVVEDGEDMEKENYLNGTLIKDNYTIEYVIPQVNEQSTTVLGRFINTSSVEVSDFILKCTVKKDGVFVAEANQKIIESIQPNDKFSIYLFLENTKISDFNELDIERVE